MNSESDRQLGSPWNFLAPREKQFLELIYQVDIEARNLKRKQSLSQGKAFLDQQSWLFYANSYSDQRSRLKQMLFRSNLSDEDTYSAFELLTQNGLIESSRCSGGIKIRLTDWGYQVVRASVEENAAAGGRELSEAAWCVLACACAFPTNFVSAVTGESFSGESNAGFSCERVSQETLRSLTQFFLPLIEQYGGWVRATEFGQVFYVEQYSYYSVRYRAIAASPPTYSKADVMERLKRARDLPKLVRLKRYEKSLNEAAAAIGAKGITPTLLYRLEQHQLDLSQVLSPAQRRAIRRWIEEEQ